MTTIKHGFLNGRTTMIEVRRMFLRLNWAGSIIDTESWKQHAWYCTGQFNMSWTTS